MLSVSASPFLPLRLLLLLTCLLFFNHSTHLPFTLPITISSSSVSSLPPLLPPFVPQAKAVLLNLIISVTLEALGLY